MRKLGRRLIAAVMCTALLLTGVTGCSSEESASGTSSEASWFTPALDTSTEQTILILGNYENFEALDAAGESFKEFYPNIDIEYEMLDDYNNNISSRLESDTEAALFMVSRYNFLNDSTLSERFVDISTLDIEWDDIDPESYKGRYIDDKLFSIPIFYRYYGLVVNKDLLESESIAVPNNLDELYAACETLLSDGYVPLQQAADSYSLLLINMEMNIIAKTMTAEQIESLRAGGSAEPLTPVFDIYIDMLNKGYISYECAETYEDSYNDAILKFFEGNVPFLLATSTTVSGMKKRESKSEAFQANPFEYEFIYAPIGADGPLVYKADDTGFGINVNCSYMDVAKEFYRFIYTEEILNQFSEIKGVPATAKNTTNELYNSLPDVTGDSLVTYSDIDDPDNALQDSFGAVVDAIVNGTVTTSSDAAALFEEHSQSLNQTGE